MNHDELSHRMDRMEKLLVQLIQEKNKSVGHRIGGIDLAMEVTGYKTRTIYKKIKDDMPHRKKGGKLIFKEKDLIEWLTGEEVIPMVTRNRTKRTRPSLLDSFKAHP